MAEATRAAKGFRKFGHGFQTGPEDRLKDQLGDALAPDHDTFPVRGVEQADDDLASYRTDRNMVRYSPRESRCGRYHASGEKTGSDGKGNHICRNGRNLCDIRIVDFHSDAVQSRNLSDFKTVN